MELNAEQVKKALECWGSGIPCHEKCSILEHEGSGNCLRLTTINAIALITSQEQRIKELEAELATRPPRLIITKLPKGESEDV